MSFAEFYERCYGLRDQYNFMNNLTIISDSTPQDVLYEQLAEEASELSQAALKKARKLRGYSPTPKTHNEIDSNLNEELSDIYLMLLILDLHANFDICIDKAERWVNRLRQWDTNCQN